MRRFVQIAMGSASEIEYHLLLARDLTLLSEVDDQRLDQKVIEIKRMLASLLGKLRHGSRPSNAGIADS